MASKGFQFRQFYLAHDRCAMKVGVDSVLLGSWVAAGSAKQILDIGTGSGLLALMMAQKFPLGKIDAVEIDADAAEQAKENFNRSPWADRLSLYEADVTKWDRLKLDKKYDLIICNPPYYEENAHLPEGARKIAREQKSLGLRDLVDVFTKTLSLDGQVNLVLPALAEMKFLDLIKEVGLRARKRCLVFGSSKKTRPNRIMLELSWQTNKIDEQNLIVRDGNDYTTAYKQLCQDFYLSGRTV